MGEFYTAQYSSVVVVCVKSVHGMEETSCHNSAFLLGVDECIEDDGMPAVSARARNICNFL